MGIPGVSTVVGGGCAPAVSPSGSRIWIINSTCPSSCFDRRHTFFSPSRSLTSSGASVFRGDRGGHRSKRSSRLNNSRELRQHAVCSAQETDTLSKVAEDDSPVRSQGAATIYQDPSIYEEKKVVGESDSSGDDKPFRPKRINFDYGFQAKFLRVGPTVPGNVFRLAFENFGREWRALRRSYLFGKLGRIQASEVDGGIPGLVGAYAGRGFILCLRGLDKFLTFYDGLQEIKPLQQDVDEDRDELRLKLQQLVLSNEKVWEREHSRDPVQAPWWILGPYYFLCLMLDVIFKDRPIQRFWFLETVARMPYFSYISMLHLYETLGWWRSGADVRKVHFAEEWNEMHHLKIMESLGGDLEWGDRFFGQHAAILYYWVLNAMFLVSPSVAYNFSELIEAHAVDTYGEFADENEALLKSLPPPPVAVAYYEGKDLYMYDEFQTSRLPESRRPKMDSLYDVFVAICGDEGEHVKTMVACQELDTPVISPHRLEKMRK